MLSLLCLVQLITDSTLHKVLVLPRMILVHLLDRRAKGDLIASFTPKVFYALSIAYYCVSSPKVLRFIYWWEELGFYKFSFGCCRGWPNACQVGQISWQTGWLIPSSCLPPWHLFIKDLSNGRKLKLVWESKKVILQAVCRQYELCKEE